MNKKERILVAGGSGLLGNSLLKKLIDNGWENIVTTYHIKEPSFFHENVKWICADLTEFEQCKNVVSNCSYVIHGAAFSQGAKMMQESPLALINNNIMMHINLMKASYESNIKKFIGISSSTAYPDASYVTEDMMFKGEPWHKYYGVGGTKLYFESLMKLYSKMIPNPMLCISLRPSNIYGPHDKFDPDKCHVLPATIRKVLENDEEIIVWGDGKDLRDLIYVDDMTDAICLALEKCDEYDAFNISSGKIVSVNDIIHETMKICNKEHLKIKYDLNKPTMIRCREIDNTKAKKVLGFEPKVSLQEGLKKTIDWYKKEYVK